MAVIEGGRPLGEAKAFERQYAGTVDLLGGNTTKVAAPFAAACAAKRSEGEGIDRGGRFARLIF